MGLLDSLKSIRGGGVSGINATQNNFKMTAILTLPVLVGYFVARIFLPDDMYNVAMGVLGGGWLIYCICLYAWAKADANNYIVFAGAKWKFQDGTCKTFDHKVPPDSWEKIADFSDGSRAYKVLFADKYEYDDPDLSFPVVFDFAYWIVPDLWDIAFQRRAFGEFFHKGVFISKPDTEDISVYVVDWEIVNGQRIPICIINDCSLTYQRALKSAKLEVETFAKAGHSKGLYTCFADARKQVNKLSQHDAYLEERVEVAEKDSSEDFRDSAENRMKSVRGRHRDIMDVKEKWYNKVFTIRNIVILSLLVMAFLLIGRFVFNIF